MSLGILSAASPFVPPPELPGGPDTAARAVAPVGAAKPDPRQDDRTDRVEIDFKAGSTAYGRAITLAQDNRELHFSRSEETGRIIVQVRTLDGEVVRTIPDEQARAILALRRGH